MDGIIRGGSSLIGKTIGGVFNTVGVVGRGLGEGL